MEKIKIIPHRTAWLKSTKDKLIKKYGCVCGYCKAELFDGNYFYLDHYYPRSLYPEKEFEEDNCVLACAYCNKIKCSTLPVVNGKKRILHPYMDDYSAHMHMDGDGKLIFDTPEGESTIEIMKLNRETLCRYRLSNPSFWNKKQLGDDDPTKSYNTSIGYIKKLLAETQKIKDSEIRRYSLRMLYGNVVTVMETFFSSTIVRLIRLNEKLKWRFVEKYDWSQENVQIKNIKKIYEEIDIRILTELGNLLYHNIPKVKNIYKDALGIEFLCEEDCMKQLCSAVGIRHDIVHRNGHTPISKKKEWLL